MRHASLSALALSLSVAALALSGCALTETASPIAEQGTAIVGNIHGGQQPVVGAHVYLFQAATTGYGAASTSLLKSSATGLSDTVGAYVLTAADGSFSISNDYTCTPGTQAYLYALGGNPGSGTNSAAGFLAALGNCPAAGNFAGTVPYIWMNEVSTVAAAYAFAGYAIDATHVGSSGTALAQTGIANAFATAANLVSTSTGIALATTPSGNAAVPQTTINTVANVLASCVNASNANPGNCTLLFAASKSAGSTGTTATDTATAAIYIAHYPANNVSILYSTLAATQAFAPSLSAQPNDFTLSLSYTGGGLNKPQGIAVDGSGNVWVANFGGTGGVSKILATGAFAPNSPFTGGGVGTSDAIAIDASGNAWVPNYAKSTLSELNSLGGAISTSAGFSGGGLNAPDAVAIDANGFVWVGNSTRNICLSEFNSFGVALSGTNGYTGNGCGSLDGVAIDNTGDVWAVNNSGSAYVEFYPSSNAQVGTEIRAGGNGGIASPTALAVNSLGDVWVANGGKNSTNVSAYHTSTGQSLAGPTGYTGGGINDPYGVAVDGASNIWFANYAGSISEFNTAGTALSPATTGYATSALNTPYAIAVDGSGNIWIADSGANAVVETIGLATPVVTPLVAGLKTPYAPGIQP